MDTSNNSNNNNNSQQTSSSSLSFSQEEEEEIMIDMQECIAKNESHPILDEYRYKLSQIHNVQIEQIQIVDVFAGSVNFKYTVQNLTEDQIIILVNKKYLDIPAALRYEIETSGLDKKDLQ